MNLANLWLHSTKAIVFPILLLLIASLVLLRTGYPTAGWLLSTFGTPLVLGANLAYVVLWHSKKRWPGTTAAERFVRIMTFRN